MDLLEQFETKFDEFVLKKFSPEDMFQAFDFKSYNNEDYEYFAEMEYCQKEQVTWTDVDQQIKNFIRYKTDWTKKIDKGSSNILLIFL